MALAFVAGGIAATGQAPWEIWPLTLVALGLVFALSLPVRLVRDVGLVWWSAGCGYFALALSWIVEPFFVDYETHGWMAPFALVFMSGGLALFWGGAGALARWICSGSGTVFGVATVLAMTMAGVVRGVIFTGFPWALPGHVLIPTPALQLAEFGGAILLTLIVLGLAVGLAFVRSALRLAVWAGALALIIGAGFVLRPAPVTDGRPMVRLVQPNVPQADKWDPALAPAHFERLLSLSRSEADVDLVVWPETAVPAWLEDVPHLMPVISDAAGGVPVVFGINRSERARVYNTLVLLDDQARIVEVYDKHHLVPFGEYTPFGDQLARIGIRGLAQQDGHGFSPGTGARMVEIPGIGPTVPLICYEGIFARDISNAPGRPALLLLITNDAWFGTVSGPYQHLAQARLRSVEQGVPMVRVANTGVSAVIDPAGRLTGVIPLGKAGAREVVVPAPRAGTIYARIGDVPLVLLLVAALAVLGVRNRHNL
jgi:apolipoprotein N-acyltransferase